VTAVHAKPRHVLALLAIGGVLATAAPSVASTAPQRTAQPSWRVAWGAAVDAYVATSQWTAHPTQAGSPSANGATYRFIVRPTISGTAVRLRFANVTDFGLTVTGATPVAFDAVDVGLRQGSAGANIVRGPSRRVTFGGKSSVTVLPGGSVLSDPLKLNVPRLKDLAVSVYVPTPSNPPFHAQTYVMQYVTAAGAGNHAADISGRAFTTVQEPIYWLDAVDVLTTAPRAIAVIGDSINDIWNTTRAQVNQWIRTAALFDGVLDIAKTVGRPGDDNSYQPHYDSGDHLHPSTAGYKAIADGLNLAFLQRASRSTHS
jgi:hypothetical protein